MERAVIVSTARTPIGKAYRGAFNNTDAASLGGHAIKHAIQRSGVPIDAIGAKDQLIRELQEIGWSESDFKPLSSNLEGALNQAAFVMQKLRSNMGDVHGTKRVVTALVYDSVKWSLLLLRILVTRNGF